MQIKFIENLILGFATEISIFRIIKKRDIIESGILDGLQRLTAIDAFFRGDFKIFNNIAYSAKEFRPLPKQLKIKTYDFIDIKKVIELYVAINENITHSKSDIKKAKSFLEKL